MTETVGPLWLKAELWLKSELLATVAVLLPEHAIMTAAWSYRLASSSRSLLISSRLWVGVQF